MTVNEEVPDSEDPGSSEADPDHAPAWLERAARVGAYAAAALAGILVLVVAGSAVQVTRQVGPLDVRFDTRPASSGATVVALPPLGEMEARTHPGPWQLHAEVVRIRPSAAADFVEDPAGEIGAARKDIVRDSKRAVRDLVLRVVVTGVVLAFVVALAITRRLRYAATASAAALAFGLGTVLLAAGGWNAAAFREPSYEGLLSAAPQAVGNIQEIEANFDEYRSALAAGVGRLGRIYVALTESDFTAEEVAAGDVVRVLHMSDVHLNPVAFALARQLIGTLDVDVVVDSGDLTDFGSGIENIPVLEGIASLGVPYLFVRGNHDSVETAAAVDGIANATVLNDMRVDVAGLSFWGMADPAFSPDRENYGERTDVDDAHAAAAAEVRKRLRAVGGADVVVVHSPDMAADIDGDARETHVVLSGDEHRSGFAVRGATLVITTGTTGGSGLRGVRDKGPVPLEASVLGFDSTSKRLLYWDEISVAGSSGASLAVDNVTITRHRVGWEDTGGNIVPVVGGG
ncbi:MAG: metallophosphoesterase family protein [Acidimicrobiia bacterium]|nr:metallophosphoesterase family protein [Acidimicrobiia bacterium]